jgi:hypothetical protein
MHQSLISNLSTRFRIKFSKSDYMHQSLISNLSTSFRIKISKIVGFPKYVGPLRIS